MSANTDAFLACLSQTEGTGDEYGALFGYKPGNRKVFTDFSQHPHVGTSFVDKSGAQHITTAAGRYQIIYPTWVAFLHARGPHDFGPASQDECALWLIENRGAFDDVEAGRFRIALDKCAPEWASLPASTVPQPVKTYAFAESAYLAAGGTIA
jgi:muramidase (phage lysozyme)